MEPIVAPEWLADHLGEVVLADVRWYLDGRSGLDAYRSGHLPGAVWIDLAGVLADPPSPERGRHPLPDPERFAAGLAAAGLGDDQPVVAYDDLGGMAAGRLVWLLRVLGQPAALLDGGLQAWSGPLATGDVHRPPAHRTARPWPAPAVATASETAAMAAGGGIVLDARAPERFRGEVEPIDARAGHIPGARNAPFAANLDPAGGRFRAAAELRRTYEELGVGRDHGDVIVYCGSGVSACHDLLALEHAGFDPARTHLYPGSWSQWSADPARQVATGAD